MVDSILKLIPVEAKMMFDALELPLALLLFMLVVVSFRVFVYWYAFVLMKLVQILGMLFWPLVYLMDPRLLSMFFMTFSTAMNIWHIVVFGEPDISLIGMLALSVCMSTYLLSRIRKFNAEHASYCRQMKEAEEIEYEKDSQAIELFQRMRKEKKRRARDAKTKRSKKAS